MKKTFLLSFFITAIYCTSYAQMNDTIFRKQWSVIDALITEKGLPKSALAKVNELLAEARSKKMRGEILKALIYKMSLEQQVQEDNPDAQIAALEKEIAAAKDPAQKSLLQVILANRYETFFNNNAWRIYQRSKTASYKKASVNTWGADDFDNTISALYMQALQPALELQQTKLQPYSAVIIKGNTENLRPTLYDLLAHKALAYFKNSNNYLTRPAYAFEINDPAALADASAFMEHPFNSADTASHLLKTIHLYQDLLKLHSNDADPSAFTDVNIERIEWVEENGVMDDKTALYKACLQSVTKQFTDNPGTAQAWYLLAKTEADKASAYQPFGDTTNRFKYAEARKTIEERLKAQPAASEGNSNMLQLLSNITKKELQTRVENINTPGAPFRMHVQYRNMETMYIRIISAAELEKISNKKRYEENYWEDITALPYISSFTQVLPQTNDHQQHAVEIKMNALQPGSYAVLASSGAGFKDGTDKLIVQLFDVSGISFINNGNDYFVLNRDNGQPLKNVQVRYEVQHWDYRSQKFSVLTGGDITPDQNGFFTLRKLIPANERNTVLHFSSGKDSLTVRTNNYYEAVVNFDNTYYDQHYEKNNANLFFFTDRSIYRPGQTVYFKAIGITKDQSSGRSKIITSKDAVVITLKDANGRKVDSLSLQLNDYGSMHGQFKLRQNVLTGNFSIASDAITGNTFFNVEEYKRPKFYIAFDTLTTTFRLSDTIKITGYAKAYAGNAVDGAVVNFNVKRTTRFIYPWMFWRSIRPVSESQQITQGTIKTGTDGKFEISFTARPDASVDKATDPVFDFMIEADVTDINGETRNGSTNISVGYKSLQLQLSVPELADAASFKTIPVSATNLSGKVVPAEVQLKIFPLVTPEKLYRNRYWQRPDQFVMSKKEFEQLFPYDEYADESDYHTWKKSAAIFTDTVLTAANRVSAIQSQPLAQGWYAVEATATDKDGNTVKDLKYVQLYTMQSATLPSLQNNWQLPLSNIVQPGEQAKLMIATNEKDIFVIQQLKQNKENRDEHNYTFYALSNNKKLITTDTKEDDRRGLGIYYAFVKHNRVYTGGMDVQMPYPDKELQVTYSSFRDKTEPGSKEQWTVTVKGKKGEQVAAELLSAMYDASLDQFKPHSWYKPEVWPLSYTNNSFNGNACFSFTNSEENYLPENVSFFDKRYDELAVNAEDFWYKAERTGGIKQTGGKMDMLAAPMMAAETSGKVENLTAANLVADEQKKEEKKTEEPKIDMPAFQPRKNFNETAFFFPQLHADSSGSYTFNFTIPEALTQWKWLSLAHTKDLAFGLHEQTIVTQKTLMVQPNMPRFVREGDRMEMITKISNLSDTALTGQASFQLIDAITNEPVDGLFQNAFPDQYFTAEAGRSTEVKFPVTIPFSYNKPLTVKIIAKAGNYTDGEENTIPVLTNRILVTESLPLYMRGDGTKQFKFEKLLQNTSQTLTNESITVEYTPNPVWYAVQALPYLAAYPQECAEQVFNRLYANTLAAYIAAQHPRIKIILQQWQSDTTALLSNLEKNQELKQVLLEETPWVLDAENETQQKKNIALLFDMIKMSEHMQTALQQLKQMQMEDGSFPWFKGGYPDRYITQYIITGMGKLQKLNAIPDTFKEDFAAIISRALDYTDEQVNRDYSRVLKSKVDKNKNHLSAIQIQYLFMRSYFRNIPLKYKTAHSYYFYQSMQYWNKQPMHMKGMIAVMLFRNYFRTYTYKNIIPSILENTIDDPEKGMYFKNAGLGYYWHQNPIEQQALMIELLNEMAPYWNDPALKSAADNMGTWLLLNKQTNNWKTTKATADACYALLLNGNDELSNDRVVQISLGGTSIQPPVAEAGTGYIRERIPGNKIQNGMADVRVSVSPANDQQLKHNGPSWGAVYWQYFEDIDKITAAASPLSVNKKLFIEKNTAAGKVLEPVNNNDELKVGDKVIIRVELQSDRNMEYLHLKDMRAATMEPLNVLSSYKWQDGLGYYEATKDAATNFFISYLPKGMYVFEYPVHITHTGNFSVGIASIQCMYAPEFTSHSEGIRIDVRP